MKLFITVFAAILVAAAPCRAQDTDPVVAFRSVVSALPKRGVFASDKSKSYDISDVAFDVKRTNSLVNPTVGLIAFTITFEVPGYDHRHPHPYSMRYRLEFAWINDHWAFSRIRNDETGTDFTNFGGGKDILDADPMRAFLVPYLQTKAVGNE
jgi:hypothetical protein